MVLAPVCKTGNAGSIPAPESLEEKMTREEYYTSGANKNSFRGQYDHIRQEFQRAQNTYDELLRTLREACPHENTSYQSDASGNNGGGYECLDCERWLGKHPR